MTSFQSRRASPKTLTASFSLSISRRGLKCCQRKASKTLTSAFKNNLGENESADQMNNVKVKFTNRSETKATENQGDERDDTDRSLKGDQMLTFI